MRRHASPVPHAQEWAAKIALALETEAYRPLLPLPIDGLVLVPSRSLEDADHEVHVSGPKIVRCSGPCGMHPTCWHRAAVFTALRVEQYGPTEPAFLRSMLDSEGGRIRLVSLIDLHLVKPKRPFRRWWLGTPDVPEVKSLAPAPAVA